MKTGIFRIVATLFAAVSLVAAYFAAEFYHENSASALARHTFSATLPECFWKEATLVPFRHSPQAGQQSQGLMSNS